MNDQPDIPTIPKDPDITAFPMADLPPPMAPSITHDDDTEEADRQEREREMAFDGVFRWRGVELHPFSSSRKSLFAQHRVAMGAPTIWSCLKDMEGFLADASRILFLCSYEPDQPLSKDPADPRGWNSLRSEPLALQTKIDRWADANIPGHEEDAAIRLAWAIYQASQTNRHEPAPAPRVGSDALGN
jgi:hypothetical protein